MKTLLTQAKENKVTSYITIKNDKDTQVLKLLSLFGYITYNITGGREPEIFVRLNSPEKIASIVSGQIPYRNDYPRKIRERNSRDKVIMKFFFESNLSDEDRWKFIEDYFLGKDIVNS